jgi:dipeptidyl aminopeptidase/acylaminoacyl peptidase
MKSIVALSRSLALCACLCAAIPAAAHARVFTINDYDRIVSINDAQISPDGRRIVIVVGHIDAAKDRTLNELVLVNVATGAQRVLTHGRDDVGEPRWSPHGNRLAFTASSGSGDAAKTQVWVMPMNGGTAHVVTEAPNGVEAYAWSPNGNAVAYLMEQSAPKHAPGVDLFNVGDDPFSTQHPAQPTHLFTQSLAGGAPEQLTYGARSIWPDPPSWSADGKYIAFERITDGRFDSVFSSRIAVIDVATKRVTVVDHRWALVDAFAPVGDRLAYTAGEHGSFVFYNGLAIASMNGERRWGAPDLDRNVQFLAWLPGGKGLIVSADDHVWNPLWRVSTSGTTQRVALGSVNFQTGSVAKNGSIAFVASSSTRPSELYYLAPGSDTPRRLTDYNGDIAALDLAPSREFVWHNDGMLEDGVLTYPVGYERGKKYPLVLVIHGGPIDEASTTAFNSLVQLLAAHGFIVLEPNYRGSDNLGYGYAHAIIGLNPIAGPGSDDVAGIEALEATGAVDASRIGVSGWSAGGWSTSWLITHYDIFKAAVSGAAVNDQIMQYTLSQGPAFIPELYGGLTPWEPGGLQAYRDSSPITYVQNVHAATLILSDTIDPRVPTPEAYEFFKALRDLGKHVQLTVIPAYGHHPSDPVHNREIDRIWVNWMVKYLSPGAR